MVGTDYWYITSGVMQKRSTSIETAGPRGSTTVMSAPCSICWSSVGSATNASPSKGRARKSLARLRKPLLRPQYPRDRGRFRRGAVASPQSTTGDLLLLPDCADCLRSRFAAAGADADPFFAAAALCCFLLPPLLDLALEVSPCTVPVSLGNQIPMFHYEDCINQCCIPSNREPLHSQALVCDLTT